MAYTVVVADNFHYMDRDEEYVFGAFQSVGEAIEACRKIVDESLGSAFQPGMTAETLWLGYTTFGEDPRIEHPGTNEEIFSAWTYAKARCAEICGATEAGNDTEQTRP